MICNILCVGTELLLGQIADTNSSYIAEKLADAGIESHEHRSVGDNPERIASAIKDLLKNSDALIISGGLGPTHDDITREVVASVMEVELEQNEKIVESIKEIFSKRYKEMPESNLHQAMVPKGARVIENYLGTAPGLICSIEKKIVYLVPGFPHELKPMVENTIIGHLINRAPSNTVIKTRTLKSWGIPESELAVLLSDVIEECETGLVKIGFLARGIDGIHIKLSIKADSTQEAEREIASVEKIVREIIGDAIYATDNENMESVVGDLLRDRNMVLSIAESLTGGMIQSRVVDVEKASEVFCGGAVTYATELKHSFLDVNVKDIYSNECAQQMASGIRKTTNSDIAISTTGVAGPHDEEGHPPGEVFIGLSTERETISKRFMLGGDRKRVREYTTITALNFLRNYLLGNLVDSKIEISSSE